MKNHILLFDIDNTIFDTAKFKKITTNKLFSFIGVKEPIYRNITQRYLAKLSLSTDFNISEYIQLLADNLHINKKYIEDVYINDLTTYKECIFPDALKVLKKLSKHHILGIFSEGFENFQLDKLIKSNIIKYFNQNYILIDKRKLKLKELIQFPLQCTIIDDNLSVLENMRGIDSIWINRKTQENNLNIKTIHDLSELLLIYK